MTFNRGEIYYIHFPYTFDVNFPKGKKKFVVVLQEGSIFEKYDSVAVLLITSDEDCKGYETNVTIETGTTQLTKESYVVCAQPYTLLKKVFESRDVWCAGQLSVEKLDEIDEKLYLGLCMGIQSETTESNEE